MNLWDLLILAVLTAGVLLALRAGKKRGGCHSCGCGSCDGCEGCTSCRKG